MERGMYEGWYSLLWDSYDIHVIFSTGVSTIKNTSIGLSPAFDVSDISKIVGLAKSHGLDEKYMAHHLQDGIEAFKRAMTSKKACIAYHLRRIAKCLCQITDIGILPVVDQVQGTIILDRNCPDHKDIGRDGKHSERKTETSIKPKMLPDKCI